MSITKEELQQGLAELQKQSNEAIKEVQKSVLEKSEAQLASASKRLEEVEAEKAEMVRRIGELEAKAQANANKQESTKLFNDYLGEAIRDNFDAIKSFNGNEVKIQMKAVGDMSTANFAGTSYANITTDYRQGVLPLPTERIWLSDVLPSGTTNANVGTIWYPRHTGGEGGVNNWGYGTGSGGANESKPKIDFDFDGVSDAVQWLAGIVKIPRQMLDDVNWMESFLRTQLLLSLKKRENQQILNGTGTGTQLKGIIPQASAYTGSYTVGIERIVDAAYGQVEEADGFSNLAILHPRDAVAIGLNKATGSGEYDLPPGTIGYVNGQLTIAGLQVVRTKEIDKGEFLVGDRYASQFITRMSPEIRIFEQNDKDVETNMLTVRIEERAALATYYPTWWVKGDLAPTT